MHPHQDYCLAQLDDLYFIPDSIPPSRATLASNMETVVTAIWDAPVQLGDRVLLVGFGGIGSLLAQVLSLIAGVELIIVDKALSQVEIARTYNFETQEFMEVVAGSFDLAFNTSGSQEGLQLAIDAVGFEGRVVDLSWYGDRSVSLSLGESFHSMRKQIISSQVSSIPANRQNCWTYKRRKALVFKLLENPLFDRHITHIIPFAKTPDFFKKLLEERLQKRLACVIQYP